MFSDFLPRINLVDNVCLFVIIKMCFDSYTCLIFIHTEIIAKNQLPNTKRFRFFLGKLGTCNEIVLISKSNYVQTIESCKFRMTSHLCRFHFPYLHNHYGLFKSRISPERFTTRIWVQRGSTHLSLNVPKMLLWKFGPFEWTWFGFVESESGPPTSIGESDLDGVGLVVEFWSLWKSGSWEN